MAEKRKIDYNEWASRNRIEKQNCQKDKESTMSAEEINEMLKEFVDILESMGHVVITNIRK